MTEGSLVAVVNRAGWDQADGTAHVEAHVPHSPGGARSRTTGDAGTGRAQVHPHDVRYMHQMPSAARAASRLLEHATPRNSNGGAAEQQV